MNRIVKQTTAIESYLRHMCLLLLVLAGIGSGWAQTITVGANGISPDGKLLCSNFRTIWGTNICTVSQSSTSACTGAVTIPQTVRYDNVDYKVQVYDFQNNNNITSVTIPEGVDITQMQFARCYNLTTVNMPATIESIYSTPGSGYIIEIPESAFENCRNLTTINLPEGLQKIGIYAFNFCYALPSIVIPESVTAIEGNAFKGCRSMTTINIPANCLVNETAFYDENHYYNSKITTLTIANPLYCNEYNNGGTGMGIKSKLHLHAVQDLTIKATTVASNGFLGITSLRTVTIDPEVVTMGTNALQSCTNITSITVNGDNEHPSLLTTLDCHNLPNLETLDVTKAEVLESLNCNTCPKIETLDLTHNTALKMLDCHACNLSELDLSNCTALVTVNTSQNHLTALSLQASSSVTGGSTATQTKTVVAKWVGNNILVPISISAVEGKISNLMVDGVAYNPATQLYTIDGQVYLAIGDDQHTPANRSFFVTYDYDTDNTETAVNPMDVTLNTTIAYTITFTTTKAVGSQITLSLIFPSGADVSWEGLAGKPSSSGTYMPALTSQTVTIYGDVTAITLFQQNVTSLITSADPLLTAINCQRNQLTALDVTQNTALTNLICNSNQLTALDVTENTSLTNLDCSYNSLTSLDVSENTALTTLNCGTNSLSTLDVDANTALTNLYCNNNQLTELDVTHNTALTTLWCNNNLLEELNVTNNTALLTLLCNNNQLEELDVTNNTAMTTLNCSVNQIGELDVTENTALTMLNCGENLLEELNVTENTALNQLICYTNHLSALDVSENTALNTIVCSNNHLTTLDLSANTSIMGGATSPQAKTVDAKIILGYIFVPINNDAVAENITNLQVNGSSYQPDAIPDEFMHLMAPFQGQDLLWTDEEGNVWLNICKQRDMPTITPITVTYTYVTGNSNNAVKTMDVTLTVNLPNFIRFVHDKHYGETINMTLTYAEGADIVIDGVSEDAIGASGVATNYTLINGIVYVNGDVTGFVCNNQELTILDVSHNRVLETLECTDNHLMVLNADVPYIETNVIPSAARQTKTVAYYIVDGKLTVPILGQPYSGRITDVKLSFDGTTFTDYAATGQIITKQTEVAYSLSHYGTNATNALEWYLVIGNEGDPVPAKVSYNYVTIPAGNKMDVTLTLREPYTFVFTNEESAVNTNIQIFMYGDNVNFDGLEFVEKLVYNACIYRITKPTVTVYGDLYSFRTNYYPKGSIFSYNDTIPNGWTVGAEIHDAYEMTESFFYTEYSVLDFTCRKYIPYPAALATGNFNSFGQETTQITGIDAHNSPRVNIIEAPYGKISSLNVSGCTRLMGLNLRHNLLESLDVSTCTILTDLHCGYNRITSEGLHLNDNVQYLGLEHNKLTTLAMDNSLLYGLYVFSNELTSLSVTNCEHLVDLRCEDNNLTASTFSFAGSTHIVDLRCDNNPLGSLNLSGLTELACLSCSNTNISSLDVSGISLVKHHCNINDKGLIELYCDHNHLTSLNVSSQPNLRVIKCNDNELTSLILPNIPGWRRFDNNSHSQTVSSTALVAIQCQNNHLMSLDNSKHMFLHSNVIINDVCAGRRALSCIADDGRFSDHHMVSRYAFEKLGGVGFNVSHQTRVVTPALAGGALGIRMPADAWEDISDITVNSADYEPEHTLVTDDSDNKYLNFATPAKDLHFGDGNIITYNYDTHYEVVAGSTPFFTKYVTNDIMDVTLTFRNAHVQRMGTAKVNISGTDKGLGTLYLDYPAVVPEGTTAWYCTAEDVNMTDNTMTYHQIDGVIPANTGFVTRSDTYGNGDYYLFNRADDEAVQATVTGNIMTGSTENSTCEPRSVLTLGKGSEDGTYGFWIYTGTNLSAWRTWIPVSSVPEGSGGSGANGYTMVFDDDPSLPTAITDRPIVDNAATTGDGNLYNIAGQRVSDSYRGIVIKNGKKQINK